MILYEITRLKEYLRFYIKNLNKGIKLATFAIYKYIIT